MLKIGSFEIASNVILAPMAGCTDLPFRLIAREHGAKFCFFEMVDCNSITYGRKKTFQSILKTGGEDDPIAAQLLGRDPSKMLAGAEQILKLTKPAFLDLNAACPAKKVVKKRAGAYLLKDELELSRILRKLSSSLPIPVTVKIRTGYDKPDAPRMADLAKRCEDSGASAIFVHGRTRTQMYAGEIDYASIKAIKESVHIPVFGSGNIFDANSAKKMLDETSCDGVMVARGALGNPWIFAQIEDILKNGKESKAIDLKERKKVLKKHLSYIEKLSAQKPSGRAGLLRKAALWYMKGFPNSARIRHNISLVKKYDEMLKLIDAIAN